MFCLSNTLLSRHITQCFSTANKQFMTYHLDRIVNNKEPTYFDLQFDNREFQRDVSNHFIIDKNLINI